MAIETPPTELSPLDESASLVDLLPTMAWTITRDGVNEFVNQQCCVFTGLTRAELLATGMAGCVHPDDLYIKQQLLAQLKELRPAEYEFRMRRYDGEYIRCLARAVPIFDKAGGLVRWVGTTTEIEDMRRATDELKVQEQQLQLALESADIGVWRLKMPENELTVDERTRRHLDLDSNVIVPYEPQKHIHPEDYARATEIDVLNVDARYMTEHRIKQRDGSYRWQAIHWRALFDGKDHNAGPKLITGTSMDITPRKQAEAEREELGQQYRIALAAAELGTWSCDLEQRIMYLDERARIHLNINQETLHLDKSLERIHEQDRERTMRVVRQQLDDPAQNNKATVEFRIDHANGEVRWISSQLHATFPTSGSTHAVRVIGVTRDITASKQAEEQVQQLNADLERRVQQRTAELTAANEELESFAYSVSHDLRAPLRAMWGFCDVLVEEYGASLPSRAHKYLQHIIDGSRHLSEIIDGLLTLSRSTRGTLRSDSVDLSGIGEKVLNELARVEPDRHVTWAIEPAMRVRGDSRMIDAVMRNLLGNAWKYTANRNDARIRVYSEQLDGERVFCVEDNGAGFNMEHAEKLFQPFQRLHRQDEFTGLGIGLATVQRIIHRHGGKVNGKGAPGEGAVFRFSLPLPRKRAARTATSAQQRNS